LTATLRPGGFSPNPKGWGFRTDSRKVLRVRLLVPFPGVGARPRVKRAFGVETLFFRLAWPRSARVFSPANRAARARGINSHAWGAFRPMKQTFRCPRSFGADILMCCTACRPALPPSFFQAYTLHQEGLSQQPKVVQKSLGSQFAAAEGHQPEADQHDATETLQKQQWAHSQVSSRGQSAGVCQPRCRTVPARPSKQRTVGLGLQFKASQKVQIAISKSLAVSASPRQTATQPLPKTSQALPPPPSPLHFPATSPTIPHPFSKKTGQHTPSPCHHPPKP
jgi:hypothetical protein